MWKTFATGALLWVAVMNPDGIGNTNGYFAFGDT